MKRALKYPSHQIASRQQYGPQKWTPNPQDPAGQRIRTKRVETCSSSHAFRIKENKGHKSRVAVLHPGNTVRVVGINQNKDRCARSRLQVQIEMVINNNVYELNILMQSRGA
jgi:aspartate carbamoyltransferase catalytic subunit